MHKLRLRTRSNASPQQDGAAGAGGNGKGKGKETNNASGQQRGGLKASIRHIGADSTRNGRSGQSSNVQANGAAATSVSSRPHLSLGADQDFRTSLILPQLTRRFSLLRGPDGSLVPMNEMQARLRTQRENGRITESEEELVLNQYRLQSIYEASQVPGMYGNGMLETLQEEDAASTSGRSSAARMHANSDNSPASGQDEFRRAYSPFQAQASPSLASVSTPIPGQSPSGMSLASPSTSASASTATGTPVSTGFASSSAAEFYAARDAVLRGNGLFGGGGLERDVISKMNSSQNLLAASTGTSVSGSESQGRRSKSRYRSMANQAQSDASNQHSGDGSEVASPRLRSPELVPPVPRLQAPQQEDEYDPYRPEEYNSWKHAGHADHDQMLDEEENAMPHHDASTSRMLQMPMSRKQFNRLSRALDDVEADLAQTYSRIVLEEPNGHLEAPDAAGFTGQQRYGAYQDHDFSPSEDEEHGYGFDGDRTFHSSTSESTSSEYHHGRSSRAPFVYDDTEEIDPPLTRLPSQQELNARLHTLGESEEDAESLAGQYDQSHPRIELDEAKEEGSRYHFNGTDGQNGYEYTENQSRPTSDQHSAAASTPTTSAPRNEAACSSSSTLDVVIETDNHLAPQSTYGQRLSAVSDISKPASSPGLPYLQATPPPPVQEAQFPSHSSSSSVSSDSVNMQTSISNRTVSSSATSASNSNNPRTPLSAVNSTFSRLARENGFSPAHSRNNSSSSSINPPLSPPPSCGLPPLPSSASSQSLASLAGVPSSEQHHAKIPSVDSVAAGSPTLRRGELPLANQTETIAFPTHNGPDEHTVHPQPNGHTRNYSIDSDHQSEGEHRRLSTTSAGSSWRGAPGGGRTLSTSTADFDFAALPLSPSKATHRMTGIEEDIDEDGQYTVVDHEEEQRKALQYLHEHAPGLQMHDLRDIQDRLVERAAERNRLSPADAGEKHSSADYVSQISPFRTSPPDSSVRRSEANEDIGRGQLAGTADAGLAPASRDQVSTDNAPKLGSPFMGPDGFASPPLQEQDHQIPSFAAEPSQNAPQRDTPSHPGNAKVSHEGTQSSDGSLADRSNTSMEAEALSRPNATASVPVNSPVANGAMSPTSPMTPSALRPGQSAMTPPSTLRSKPTRASNSTPSMLIRHVQQQATDATAALKNPYVGIPDSPDEALRRVANNPARRPLAHRKSTKSLKIGSPQLVSSSADLENMPKVDTYASSRSSSSPEIQRKPSMAGLKFKMRFRGTKTSFGGDEDLPVPHSANSSVTSANGGSPSSPWPSQQTERHTSPEPASSGIRNLVSKLRRRKVSNEQPQRLIPDPMILQSPQFSSPKGHVDALFSSPESGQGHFTEAAQPDLPSSSSRTTEMADILPLNTNGRGPPRSQSDTHSLQAHLLDKGHDRSSATSLDSMRKLYEAATALGLDPQRVNELVDAAGYNTAAQEQSKDQIVRSTVILAPQDEDYFSHPLAQTSPKTEAAATAKLSNGMSHSTSTTSSLTRSLSSRSTKERRVQPNGSPASSKGKRRQTSDESMPAQRRSVHDRPPTPPPDRQTHLRKKSESLAAEYPLPTSPMRVLQSQQQHPAEAVPTISVESHVQQGAHQDENSEDLGLPKPAHARGGKQSRVSDMSSKTTGSYDARSIYGLYGDDEEEIPPTPGLREMNMVLASGRIPGSSDGSQRASLVLAPGMSAKRLSTASRNSRIEVNEYANGDIAFNIVQSLRRGQNIGDGDRGTFYPMELHRRQASDNSFEEELRAIANSSQASPEQDPLRLLIKRHQNKEAIVSETDSETAKKALVQLQRLAAQHHSQTNQFEVYEASDEAQVSALIEELTKGLDEGQFNLSRSGTITNSSSRPKQGQTAQAAGSAASYSASTTDAVSTGSPGVRRTPSKIRRQPAPVA